MNNENSLVHIFIDDKPLTVPQSFNIVQSAALLGIEIPHFCYHPTLSVAGHCRMCQVEMVGSSKLILACHTKVFEGMKVYTHETSERVRNAQKSTLEFLLANHPLDCPICDQSGRCQLQDYYVKYSHQKSRFTEDKKKAAKAVEFGKNIIFDAERCIKCTRCVRFCDEITETHELNFLKRGAESLLDLSNDFNVAGNLFFSCVADLCPVGALTHKRWRFKTPSWFTKKKATVCIGCSSLCVSSVSVRDNEIVSVESGNTTEEMSFLCDNGRYGFDRFIPKERVHEIRLNGSSVVLEQAKEKLLKLGTKPMLVFFAPNLMLEEYQAWKRFLENTAKVYTAVVAVKINENKSLGNGKLSDYIAADQAANIYAAIEAKIISGTVSECAERYFAAVKKLEQGVYQHVIFVGDGAISANLIDDVVLEAIKRAELSVAFIANGKSHILPVVKVVLPTKSFYEKSGTVINRYGEKRKIEKIFSCDETEGRYSTFEYLELLAEKKD